MNSLPTWVAALGATLLMQSIASYLAQTLPVVAPLLTASAGLRPESIGLLNGAAAFGSVAALLLGGPLLARMGPVRMLQIGAAVAAGGLLLVGAASLPVLVLASLLLGMGYGPSAPAGSRILAATAPKGRRTLIFSVKQSGALLGGGLAGLLAPSAAAWGGLPAALLLGVGFAALGALAIQPLRARLDVERDPAQAIRWGTVFGRRALAAPFAALGLDPLLWPLALLGLSFAVVQGCLFTFTVTWLVERHGMGLVAAGSAFAAMQGAGMVARILLAMLADRTGNAMRNLVVQGLCAAAVLLALALVPPGAPVALLVVLVAACGFLGASWNGIALAEVARLVPLPQVAAATSGTTLVVFLGYTFGPAAFSALVSASGGWRLPFLLVAAQLALTAVAVGTTLLRRMVAGGVPR